MDSSSSGVASRRRKMNDPSNEDQDLISKLPDSVIGYILSLLPTTKDAVRTCVLSKRWIYLWTFVTRLSFFDKMCLAHKIKEIQFVNFVNRVLLYLNNSSIQCFELFLLEKYKNPSHFDVWISTVLYRRVKKLFVIAIHKLTLPSHSILQFQFLEELVLKLGMKGSSTFRVPNSVCFSSLTVLELSGITFTPESSTNTEDLNLKFPVLTKYKTQNCTWSFYKTVTSVVPLLQVLSIQFTTDIVGDQVLLLLNGSRTHLKFCALRLKEFIYTGPIIFPENILLDVSAVDNAAVIIDPFWAEITDHVQHETTGILASEVLKLFNSKVESLQIVWSSKVFERFKDYLASPPTFEMLNRLELHSVAGEIVLDLLLKTPLLKILIFKGTLRFGVEQLDFAKVPDCFQSNLQVVQFQRVNGSKQELSFVKFVMENALVLEKIKISPFVEHGSRAEDIKEKLLSLKRACSSVAILEFSSHF